MDTPALIATLTTIFAIGLTIVLLRILKQERQRSDARVAALVSMSSQPAAHAMPAADVAFEQRPVRLEPKMRATPRTSTSSAIATPLTTPRQARRRCSMSRRPGRPTASFMWARARSRSPC